MRVAVMVLDAGRGGHTRTASSIARSLAGQGHSVPFLIGRGLPRDVPEAAGFDPIEVTHGFRTELPAVLETLQNEAPLTAIHTFSTLGLVDALRWATPRRIPVVYTRCGGPPIGEPLDLRMMRALRLPRFTVLSEENRRELQALTGADPENIWVVPSRIDLAEMDARQDPAKWAAVRTRLNLPESTGIFLRIARVGPSYSESILTAASAVATAAQSGADVAFLHIGYADVPEAAAELAQKLQTANQNLPHLRLFSLSEPEFTNDAQSYVGMAEGVFGMGRSAFEGMAAGRPTLIVGKAAFGGLVLPETVEELAAYNFSGRHAVRQQGDLAATVARLHHDSAFRAHAGQFARRYAEDHLDVRHSLPIYTQLYQEFDPYLVPSPAQIRRAGVYSDLKRSLRNLMSKSARAQLTSRFNFRNRV